MSDLGEQIKCIKMFLWTNLTRFLILFLVVNQVEECVDSQDGKQEGDYVESWNSKYVLLKFQGPMGP